MKEWQKKEGVKNSGTVNFAGKKLLSKSVMQQDGLVFVIYIYEDGWGKGSENEESKK